MSVAVIAILVASGSLAISAWQALLNWRRYRGENQARIAIDPRSVTRDCTGWVVVLDLTNVGKSHARHIRTWLEDANGDPATEAVPVGEPKSEPAGT